VGKELVNAERAMKNAQCVGFDCDEWPDLAPIAIDWRSAPQGRRSLRREVAQPSSRQTCAFETSFA